MKMRLSSASYIVFLVMLFVFSADMTASVLPRVGEGDSLVRKSIYPPSATRKSDLYNKLWGEHYRTLYSLPITVPAVTLQSLWGGVKVVEQAADFKDYCLKTTSNNSVF